jgi:hypothetical protein
MQRYLLLFFIGLLFAVSAVAVPVDCQEAFPTLQELINSPTYVDGCFVQDKLFTGFGYTQGNLLNPDASLVLTTFALTLGPNPPAGDLHEIRFSGLGSSWVAPFQIIYNIGLYNAPPGTSIIRGDFDINVPGGGTLATGAKTLVGTNGTYTINATVGSPGSTAIAQETFLAVTVDVNPNGESVSALVDSYTQAAIPEPGTWALLGGGLVLLGALRRRKG